LEGVLLANAGESWLPGPEGLAARSGEDGVVALVLAAGGLRGLVLSAEGPAEQIRATPAGFPVSPAGGLAGAFGAIQAFPGGPRLAGDRARGTGAVAWDPVTGERLDRWRPGPWASHAGVSPLDPEPWQPESPWHRPLDLLLALGALAPVDEGEWTAPRPRPSALAWLPASLDGEPPPLGPAPDALPLAEDPVTQAFLDAILPGGSPPDADLVARTVLAGAVPLPRLPPGLAVPGLE
jgi:hypothetical protein